LYLFYNSLSYTFYFLDYQNIIPLEIVILDQVYRIWEDNQHSSGYIYCKYCISWKFRYNFDSSRFYLWYGEIVRYLSFNLRQLWEDHDVLCKLSNRSLEIVLRILVVNQWNTSIPQNFRLGPRIRDSSCFSLLTIQSFPHLWSTLWSNKIVTFT